MMNAVQTSVLALSLLAFAGTAGAVDINGICCDGGFEYRHPSAWEKEQQRVKDELAASTEAAGRSGSGDRCLAVRLQ
jgi:hypothetical protein